MQGRSNRREPTPLVQHKWYDRHSVYLKTPRAEAEDELLALAPTFSTTVLNLAGLWGGQRTPKNWVAKVAPTKEALKIKVSPYNLSSSCKVLDSLIGQSSCDSWTRCRPLYPRRCRRL